MGKRKLDPSWMDAAANFGNTIQRSREAKERGLVETAQQEADRQASHEKELLKFFTEGGRIEPASEGKPPLSPDLIQKFGLEETAKQFGDTGIALVPGSSVYPKGGTSKDYEIQQSIDLLRLIQNDIITNQATDTHKQMYQLLINQVSGKLGVSPEEIEAQLQGNQQQGSQQQGTPAPATSFGQKAMGAVKNIFGGGSKPQSATQPVQNRVPLNEIFNQQK